MRGTPLRPIPDALNGRIVYGVDLVRVWERWAIIVPNADGLHAPVECPEDAEATARAVISRWMDTDPSSFEVEIRTAD